MNDTERLAALASALKSKLIQRDELVAHGVPPEKIATPVYVGRENVGYVLEPKPDPVPAKKLNNGASGEEGEKAWDRIREMIVAGTDPTWPELAETIFEFGLGPFSDAAQYVAGRLVGDIRLPQGNDGRPRRKISDANLIFLHRFQVSLLESKKAADPVGYRKANGRRTPWVAAQHVVVREYDVGLHPLRKLVNGARTMAVKED